MLRRSQIIGGDPLLRGLICALPGDRVKGGFLASLARLLFFEHEFLRDLIVPAALAVARKDFKLDFQHTSAKLQADKTPQVQQRSGPDRAPVGAPITLSDGGVGPVCIFIMAPPWNTLEPLLAFLQTRGL